MLENLSFVDRLSPLRRIKALDNILSIYNSSIGKKYVMAITGLIGFGFVVMHMLGNLQIYLGPEKLNNYSVFLRSTGSLLWIARLTLLGAVFAHIIAALQLTLTSQQARPTKYEVVTPQGSDYASRTMRWSGPILLAFIIYHLLDLTFGKTNPNFIEGDVYHNVVASFQNPVVAGWYIVAMFLLGLHMLHGVWSLFQSLGANNSKYNEFLRQFAIVATLFVVVGNMSIPVAVLLKFIK